MVMMFITDTFITLGPIKTGEKKKKKLLYSDVYINTCKKKKILKKSGTSEKLSIRFSGQVKYTECKPDNSNWTTEPI